MVTKIYGHNKDGSFQSGIGERVRLWTIHEIRATGVLATRADLLADGLITSATLAAGNSIEFQGVTYTVDATYDDALWAQGNLSAIMAAFEIFGNVVDVQVTAGVATASTPVADFTTVFLGGGENFGTDIATANEPVWQLDIRFEQKGMFHNTPTNAGFVKGEPSLGVTADNYGSSVADINAVLALTVLTTTANDVVSVDDTTETNTETRPDAAPQVAGSATQMVSGSSADQVESQSVIVEVFAAPDLQS